MTKYYDAVLYTVVFNCAIPYKPAIVAELITTQNILALR